jgi:hypothetical protein
MLDVIERTNEKDGDGRNMFAYSGCTIQNDISLM